MTFHNSENDTNCAMLVGNLGEREKYQNQQPAVGKEIWDSASNKHGLIQQKIIFF